MSSTFPSFFPTPSFFLKIVYHEISKIYREIEKQWTQTHAHDWSQYYQHAVIISALSIPQPLFGEMKLDCFKANSRQHVIFLNQKKKNTDIYKYNNIVLSKK